MRKILFSAIGTSDPIRGLYDAGWLHCCRVEEPDLTEIYLSAYMVELEKELGLFSRTIELLNQDRRKEGKQDILLKIIERPELTKPHLSDGLYPDISGLLTEIKQQYPDAEILINCSSGTPAIKSCLTDMRVLLPFGKELKLLQVEAPEDGKNYQEQRVDKGYVLEDHWACNLDREPGYVNRVRPWQSEQHDLMIQAEYAKQLIRRHDYAAADLVLKDYIGGYEQPEKLKTALQGAVNRKQLKLNKAMLLLNEANIDTDHLANEINEKKKIRLRVCAEMLMTMQADEEAKDYANMLRKMTPLLFELAKEYVLRETQIDIDLYTNQKNGKIDWKSFKRDFPVQAETMENIIGNRTNYFSTYNLIGMLNSLEKRKDEQSFKRINVLRDVEENARNAAAHELIGIDENWVRQRTGNSPESIILLLKKLINGMEPSYSNVFWESYHRMNEQICGMIRVTDKAAGK